MKLTKKALLYDISNLAYTIADTGEDGRHTLHRVKDICQEGNIDRVSRVLGLAYSTVLTVLLPVLSAPRIDINRDYTVVPHDYEFCFSNTHRLRSLLTDEIKFKIKETIREYMVCKVLADWLAITMPEVAEVWRFRCDSCLTALKETVASLATGGCSAAFRRKIETL